MLRDLIVIVGEMPDVELSIRSLGLCVRVYGPNATRVDHLLTWPQLQAFVAGADAMVRETIVHCRQQLALVAEATP